MAEKKRKKRKIITKIVDTLYQPLSVCSFFSLIKYLKKNDLRDCWGYFSLALMGGRAEGLACARTPIDTRRNLHSCGSRFGAPVTKTPEGPVLGFCNFGWADSIEKNFPEPPSGPLLRSNGNLDSLKYEQK